VVWLPARSVAVTATLGQLAFPDSCAKITGCRPPTVSADVSGVETMLSVKGKFQNGTARPLEPVEGRDGQTVIITFLEEVGVRSGAREEDSAWNTLMKLAEEWAVETGISDLAHQHDHYLYGKPKKG
jgi:hypothetical protein